METDTLPLYEVEFIPVERRLRERRRADPSVAWPPAMERRRGERRQNPRPPAGGQSPAG